MLRSISLLPLLLFVSAGTLAAGQPSAEDLEFFERRIRPLFVEHCYECHADEAKTLHGGLRLDSATALRAGGDSGPAVDVDQPDDSLLLEVVRYDGDIQMPPEGQLSDRQIGWIREWLAVAAPMPMSEVDVAAPRAIDFETGRRFWSFQPLQTPPQPDVRNAGWPRTRLDYFILAKLEDEGLEPAEVADRRTLVRRLYFDVTGLPPAPADVERFLNDTSPYAYEQLVDRLLESPRYGEKWGRMWLDLARYTDTTASWLYKTGEAHLYRDWVVDAFNQDMPYDEFVRRQLATDLMPETGPDDLPALGFLSLSPTYWKELKLPCEIIKTIVADEWEERVDAVSRTFLGLTVACARCHDHKFDPISSADYYALAGVFASCRQTERPLIEPIAWEPVRLAKQQVEQLQAEIDKLKKKKPVAEEKIQSLQDQIKSLQATPLYDTPMANVVTEESMFIVRAGKTPQDGTRLDYRPQPRDLPLFVRGNPNRPGPIVPRGFLTVFSESERKAFQHGSGRLELASAITDEAAALTARVIVNRIWLAHFGRGLVDTPSNFGSQGSRPTHPELLEDLASRFITDGWSIKQLHREILLSATFRQSSEFDATRSSIDPDNTWYSRMNRRRLNFEEWRDAILSATGTLDLSVGGHSIELDAAENLRRTLYATVHRRDMSTTLTTHDFPDPNQHSPRRSETTTALQGLYALNGPLLDRQANALVDRLQEAAASDTERIDLAYRLLYSRPPSDEERDLAEEFLRGPESAGTDVWQQYAHVLLAANELLYID